MIDGLQVRLSYTASNGTETERLVHPLGLVAKRTVWYLVAGTDAGLRTFRVGRVRSLSPDRPTRRPAGGLRSRGGLAVDPGHPGRPPGALGRHPPGRPRRRPHPAGRPRHPHDGGQGGGETAGWTSVLRSYSPEMIAHQLAGFGARVEVVSPPETRRRLAAIAAELAAVYGPEPARSRT